MKNVNIFNKNVTKMALLTLAILSLNNNAFAIESSKVISDSASQKEIEKNFNEVNRHSDYLFTPRIKKNSTPTPKLYMDNSSFSTTSSSRSTPPIKELRLKISEYLRTKDDAKTGKKQVIQAEEQPKDQVQLSCEQMEYFAERTELEANGKVVVYFPESNSTLKADKLVYNQTSNLIKAFGHVVLISDGKEMFGDYLQVDMNEENALMENPISDVFSVQIHSKTGYMYGDTIVQEKGRILATKHNMIDSRASMFGPDVDNLFVAPKDKSAFMKESHGSKFKIKTNDLILTSKKEHDNVTFKKAEIYFNNKKLGTIPSITIHTNKNQDYVEADYPEIGTVSNLGYYAGPGFDFDTPHGTNLKLLPILNYNGSSNTGQDFGFGGIAKFKSATNKTDFAYGTASKLFIMRGLEKLDDHLFLQYASNAYMDDWFMGFRMPKLMGEVFYEDSYLKEDFIGKDLPLIYTHRIAGAYVQDGIPGDSSKRLGEDGVGSLRMKYMNEIAQTFYQLNQIYEAPINTRFEMVGQSSIALYGTGDTQIVARVGPRIHNQYKNWMQDVGYFLSTYDDKTPFINFDRYVYGRSNVYLRETYRICKYLTISWMGSYNLSGDAPDGKSLQENTFFFGIGPDDVRLNIGYDTIREQSYVTLALHLDTKGSSIEYNKMIIKNPDTLGKPKKRPNDYRKPNPSSGDQNVNNKNQNEEEEIAPQETAEVINISQEADSL